MGCGRMPGWRIGSSRSLDLRAGVATQWVEWSRLSRPGQVSREGEEKWWWHGRWGVGVGVGVQTVWAFGGCFG